MSDLVATLLWIFFATVLWCSGYWIGYNRERGRWTVWYRDHMCGIDTPHPKRLFVRRKP